MKRLSTAAALLTLLLPLGCKKTDPTPPAPEMRTVTYTFKSEAPRYVVSYTDGSDLKTANVQSSDTSIVTRATVGSTYYCAIKNPIGSEDDEVHITVNLKEIDDWTYIDAYGYYELKGVIK